MIKHPAKVFLLSALAVIFTTSNCMSIKKLATEEDIPLQDNSIEFNTQVYISRGAFEGWCFTQIYREKIIENKLTKKFVAGCFVNNCSKEFEAEAAESLEAKLMDHLDGHEKNDGYCVLAERKMDLECLEPIFSIETNLPTALLCKGPKGFYYAYKCNRNGCKAINAAKDMECKLKSPYMQHAQYCLKNDINTFVKANQHLFNIDCCRKVEDRALHICIRHLQLQEKKN